MAAMDYENDSRGYDGKRSLHPAQLVSRVADVAVCHPDVEDQRYDRDRSASPRPARRGDSPRGPRARSASPNGRMDSRSVGLSPRTTEALTLLEAALLPTVALAAMSATLRHATRARPCS